MYPVRISRWCSLVLIVPNRRHGILGVGRKLAALRDEGVMLVASSGNVVPACGLCVGTVTIYLPYPRAASFNDFVKANLTWQGPVEQHPLLNYLQHEGAPYRTRRRSTFAFAVCTWRTGRQGTYHHPGRRY